MGSTTGISDRANVPTGRNQFTRASTAGLSEGERDPDGERPNREVFRTQYGFIFDMRKCEDPLDYWKDRFVIIRRNLIKRTALLKAQQDNIYARLGEKDKL